MIAMTYVTIFVLFEYILGETIMYATLHSQMAKDRQLSLKALNIFL